MKGRCYFRRNGKGKRSEGGGGERFSSGMGGKECGQDPVFASSSVLHTDGGGGEPNLEK